MTHTTRELTKEEGDALTKDMQAVLEKHGAELGVIASVQLLKRVETPEPIPSPVEFTNGNDSTEKTS